MVDVKAQAAGIILVASGIDTFSRSIQRGPQSNSGIWNTDLHHQHGYLFFKMYEACSAQPRSDRSTGSINVPTGKESMNTFAKSREECF